MSSPYTGVYTNNLYNPSKRFRLNTGDSSRLPGGFLKAVPLADSELREISDVSDSFIRQLISANFPRGSSINDGFRVVRSMSSNLDNNFAILGGDTVITVIDNAGTFTGGSLYSAVWYNGITSGYIYQAWTTNKDTTLAAFAAQLQSNIRAMIGSDTTSTVIYTPSSHSIVITPKAGNRIMILPVIVSPSPGDTITVSQTKTGSIENAGILFVDGYILFLKSYFDYTDQLPPVVNTLTLTDDAYTKTSIPALTTPVSDRIDEVYVDFYFAEVSANIGSEYQDTSLIVTGIGSSTANRVRQVQDIRVAEGDVTPADGNDANGIFHRRVKIATINRSGGQAMISTGMIQDNRILINSVNSYSQGTTITDLLLKNGQNIGDDSNRVGAIYMASTIDYKTNDLMFKNEGTERIRFKTSGNVGIGTTDPRTLYGVGGSLIDNKVSINGTSKLLQLTENSSYSSGIDKLAVLGFGAIDSANATHATSCIVGLSNFTSSQLGTGSISFRIKDSSFNIDNNSSEKMRITSSGAVGIGTTNPQATLHVVGSALISNNLTVNGTTTIVNTEVTTTDMMTINQDDDQVALEVNQTVPGNSTTVMRIGNAGSGAALTIDKGSVGIGTTNPLTLLHISGVDPVLFVDANDSINARNSTISLIGGVGSDPLTSSVVKFGASGTTQTTAKLQIKNKSDSTFVTIDNIGNVGIGTTNPQATLHVQGDIIVTGTTSFSAGNTAADFFINDGTSRGALARYRTVYGSGTDYSPTFYSTSNLYFASGGSSIIKMLIDSSGNVGIGTTDPRTSASGSLFPVKTMIYGTSWLLNLTEISPYSSGVDKLSIVSFGAIDSANSNQSTSAILGVSNLTGGQLGTGYLAFRTKDDTFNIDSIFSERMRISANGNVGIGTTNPQAKLHVPFGSTAIISSMSVSSSGNFTIGEGATGSLALGYTNVGSSTLSVHGTSGLSNSLAQYESWFPHSNNNSYISGEEIILRTTTSNSERVRITANGNVGIGATNPQTGLFVSKAGITSIEGTHFLVQNTNVSFASGSIAGIKSDKTDATDYGMLNVINASGNKFYIRGDGKIGIGTTIPQAYLHVVGNSLISDNLIVNGKIGIGTTDPQAYLHVIGDALISNNLTVNGTTTLVNTEVTTTDMMTINQDDEQTALSVNQTNATRTSTVMTVSNAGTGSLLSLSAPTTPQIDFLTDVTKRADIRANTGSFYLNTISGNSLQFQVDNSTKMFIAPGGNVGIGTTDPLSIIDCYGTNPIVQIRSNGSTISAFQSLNSNSRLVTGVESSTGGTLVPGSSALSAVISQYSNQSMHFATNNTIRMTIDNTGSVGIGTTNPSQKFHVVTNNTPQITLQDVGFSSLWNFQCVDSSEDLKIWNSSNPSGYFYLDGAMGRLGIGTTQPQATLHVEGSVQSGNLNAITNNTPQVSLKDVGFSSLWNFQCVDSSEDLKIWNSSNPSGYFYLDGPMGRLGIGTTRPQAELHVEGSVQSGNLNAITNNAPQVSLKDIGFSSLWNFQCMNSSKSLKIWNSLYSSGYLYLDSQVGRLGIGTTQPQASLHVEGDVQSAKLNVSAYSGLLEGYSTTTTASTNLVRLKSDKSGAGSNVTVFEINALGNVGIGTTLSPSCDSLVVGGDGTATFCLSAGTGLRISGGNGSDDIISSVSGNLVLNVTNGNGTEISGNVGIGTNYVRIGSTLTSTYLLEMEASGGGYYSVSDHQWHNGSSLAIKQDVQPLFIDVMSILDSLNVVNYRYKTEVAVDPEAHEHIGFIADTAPDLLTGKDKNSMATGDCIGFLLAIVKKLKEEIEVLKSKIN